MHALLTGEREGYYAEFGEPQQLAKALTDVHVFDGCYSPFHRRRHGNAVGETPRERFVVCIQNHDQVGNRAFGERLSALVSPEARRLATALLRVASIDPMLKAVVLTPVQPSVTHRFRPETMLAAVTYNANFAAGFAAFARRQGLYVGWLGCQNENATPDSCPGVVQESDCCCGATTTPAGAAKRRR